MPIWAYIAIGWLVTALAGAGGTLWYRDQFHELQAKDAKATALAEQHELDQKAADAKLDNTLAQQTQAIKDAIAEKMNATNEALAKVANNPACANDDAARAFDSGLRTLGPSPNSGTARPAPTRPH